MKGPLWREALGRELELYGVVELVGGVCLAIASGKPPRHILHKDGMGLSYPQSGAPRVTESIPFLERVQFVVEDAWPFRERASGQNGRFDTLGQTPPTQK